jgi:hypothetical protein
MVHFGTPPSDRKKYADKATEMYAESAEILKNTAIKNPPETLEADLCERLYKWVTKNGIECRRLEPKDNFRKPERLGRSPDDGDGFVLAMAPDFVFEQKALEWEFS